MVAGLILFAIVIAGVGLAAAVVALGTGRPAVRPGEAPAPADEGDDPPIP